MGISGMFSNLRRGFKDWCPISALPTPDREINSEENQCYKKEACLSDPRQNLLLNTPHSIILAEQSPWNHNEITFPFQKVRG